MQAALPLMVVGSLVQGVGGYQAGKFNQRANNANALGAEREGAAEASRIRDLARIRMGAQIGAQAESRFMVGTGTALDSLLESGIERELEIADRQRQAASRAAAYRSAGKAAAMEGRNALIGGVLGAAQAVAGSRADYAQQRRSYGYGAGSSGGGGGASAGLPDYRHTVFYPGPD